jgi:ion channel POLLUX/CASTOR
MEKERLGLGKRLQYEFDKLFSIGPWMLIAGLALFTIVISFLAGLILVTTGLAPADEPAFNFIEALWFSLLTGIGEGGSIGGRENVWSYRFLMLFMTLASIFIVSNLIGIITTAIQSKIENLRRGRSMVIEVGHTILLGWNEQIFTIVPQLALANRGKKDASIVILGKQDKVEMEDQLRQRIGNTGSTKVICRSGDPIEQSDLELTRFNEASGVIILSPEESPNPDAEVVKSVLAITRHPKRRLKPFHIVAALRDQTSREISKVVGKGEVEWITSDDVIARIIAQTSRQPGLSAAYNELLDFNGEEIYFHENPNLIGKTYHEALLLCDRGAVVGIEHGGVPHLNPAMNTTIQAGDQVVVIAEATDDINWHSPVTHPNLVQEDAIIRKSKYEEIRENILMLGWNDNATTIIHELDQYVKTGSKVCVVSEQISAKEAINNLNKQINKLNLSYEHGSITNRQTLEGIKIKRYDHVILLSDDGNLSVQQADANTLMALLYIRDIADRTQLPFSVVTEILDERNSRLVQVDRPDDFIVSDRLISLMMAQVAQDKRRNAVYKDLFAFEGSEIYLRPVWDYVRPGRGVNFYTLIEAASRRGETAFGYRQYAYATDAEKAYGMVLNPQKDLEVTFGERDRIIVLAEL